MTWRLKPYRPREFIHNRIKEILHSPSFARRAAKEEGFFTRHRALPLPHLVGYLLNFRKGTISDELEQFAAALLGPDEPAPVTPSAFCQARKKLHYSALTELNAAAIDAFSNHFALHRWHGFRLLAVDGSTIRLPNTSAIAEVFGGPSDASCPMGRLSQCIDVLNEVILCADIAPYATGERELASPYLYAAAATDLFLYDRGYPAFWLFAQHRDMERHFCMRVALDFNTEVAAFVASGEPSALVTIAPNAEAVAQCEEYNLSAEPVTVRLVRVELDSGETEVLITSLIDQAAFPTHWFKALYHFRWGVEESYKRVKCRIEIENFSGKSPLSVYQDFHAKLLTLNLTAMFAWIGQAVADRLHAQRRHVYQINFANAITQMKNRVVRWLLGGDPENLGLTLVCQMARAVEPIRPGRSSPRKPNAATHRRFHMNYKRTR
jgi:hypothetical protein